MKLSHPAITGLAGLLASKLIRGWMGGLDYRVAYYDPAIDPVHRECRGQKIFVFWHEHILFPLYLRGNCRLAMLLSQHRDGDILARVAHHLGFECVRGSTSRGGANALRELLRKSRDLHLTITPDGPRGPRRTLAQGPIYLSSKLGLPIVLMGFGYDRLWRAPTWDRFAIPKPFARARAVVSPEIYIPPDLDRDGIEHYRAHVESFLNRLTSEAEAWAESGVRKACESPLRQQTAPLRSQSEPPVESPRLRLACDADAA